MSLGSVRRHVAVAVAVTSLSAFVNAAGAATISLHSSNVGIGSISVNQVGNVITITETWTSVGQGVLQISDLGSAGDFIIRKVMINNTGESWSSVANELLDPAGQANDALDPLPYPSFVPARFTTSNDNDGLSFAQGSGHPRTSSVFASVVADELSDTRDFLDFVNGTLADGATDDAMTFGLRDSGNNNGFLLVQRPNARSKPVPEPVSLSLLGLGLTGIAAIRRRRSA